MVSAIDRAKRSFITLLKTLAATYCISLPLNRDSADQDVRSAFKKVSRKVHPDKGGSGADQTRLTAARDVWLDAIKEAAGKHGGKKDTANPEQGLATASREERRKKEAGFRVQSLGDLLTYQKFADLAVWSRFLVFVGTLLQTHGVKHWSATLETNADGTYHLHLMLQFYKLKEQAAQDFAFEVVCPNTRPNDLLGEGCL